MREIDVWEGELAKDTEERKWCENRLLIDSMLANGLINHSRTEENWKRNWNVHTYRATNEFQLKKYLFHKMEKWVIDRNRTGYNIEIWITHIHTESLQRIWENCHILKSNIAFKQHLLTYSLVFIDSRTLKRNHTHMISLPYETNTFIYDMFNGKSSTCITSSQSHNIGLLIECLPLLSWRIKWKLKFMLRIFITCTSTCHLYSTKCHVWLTFGLDYSENGHKWIDFIVWNFKHSENTVLHARWNIDNECTKTHENYFQTSATNCNSIFVRVPPTDCRENEIQHPNSVQNLMSILGKD